MNGRSLLLWTGVSLGAHLALLALSPALRLPTLPGSRLPVHLVSPAPAANPSVSRPPSHPVSRPGGPSPARGQSRPLPAPAPSNVAPPPVVTGPPPLPPAPPAAHRGAMASEAQSSSPAPSAFPHAAAPTSPPSAGDTAGNGSSVQHLPHAAAEVATPCYDLNPPPPYPRLAQERRWQGEVLLRVRVQATGAVGPVALARSSGYGILDRAAAEAVRGWRFRPGRIAGTPTESEVLVPVRYRLEEG